MIDNRHHPILMLRMTLTSNAAPAIAQTVICRGASKIVEINYFFQDQWMLSFNSYSSNLERKVAIKSKLLNLVALVAKHNAMLDILVELKKLGGLHPLS